MTTLLDTTVARKDFANVVAAANKGERFLLKRHGKGVAAVVSVRDPGLPAYWKTYLTEKPPTPRQRTSKRSSATSWDEVKADLAF